MADTAAENQLKNFKQSNQQNPGTAVNSNGSPIGIKTASLTVGERGPILLQDVNFLDDIAHFDRERIPERVKHAKGAGAFGYFEVTNDITKYSAAKLFDKVGKKTPIAVRFSTVAGERGSADTVRDPRGFAIKFYTEEGNWDLVGLSLPIFFIRDPLLFPSFIRTQKRNPQTNLKDQNMIWDFFTLRPETTHQIMFLYSDRGIPDGYRFMNGFGDHTFKLVNASGEAVYCKFHFKSGQGIKNLDPKRAEELAGSDPDYATRDLYNAIARGDYPWWQMYIQVITFEEAEKFEFNPFDVTKIFPTDRFPLIPVGKLTLNSNPNNYFADVEQIAFAPSRFVPGILPSPDRMLIGRLFSYQDSQRHRIGTNNQQLHVNIPYRVALKTYQRDGPMTVTDNGGGAPNYYPNSFSGPETSERARTLDPPFPVAGDVYRYDNGNEDNFTQPRNFWNKVLDEPARQRLVNNIVNDLVQAYDFIQERAIVNFSQVSRDFGQRVRVALSEKRKTMTK